jgi:hypothetical protein
VFVSCLVRACVLSCSGLIFCRLGLPSFFRRRYMSRQTCCMMVGGEPRSGSPLRNSSEPVPHFKLPTPARAPLGTFSSPVPHFRLFCGRGPTSKFSVFHGLLSALVLARRHPTGFPSFRSPSPTLNFSPRHGPHLELFPRPPPTSDFIPAVAPLPTLGARAPHLRRLRIPAVDDRKNRERKFFPHFFLENCCLA